MIHHGTPIRGTSQAHNIITYKPQIQKWECDICQKTETPKNKSSATQQALKARKIKAIGEFKLLILTPNEKEVSCL